MTNPIFIVQYGVAQIGMYIITNKMRHVYIHVGLHSVNTVVYKQRHLLNWREGYILGQSQRITKDKRYDLDFSLVLYFTATSCQPFYQKSHS